MGIVTMKKLGSEKRKTSITLVKVELLWTTIPRIRGSSFMKRMKVKITPPITA
jgi:hypothetical protein